MFVLILVINLLTLITFLLPSGTIYYNQFEYRHIYASEVAQKGFSLVDVLAFQSHASLDSVLLGYGKLIPTVRLFLFLLYHVLIRRDSQYAVLSMFMVCKGDHRTNNWSSYSQ